MNENVKWIAAAVAVVGLSIGGILYFSQREGAPVAAEEPVDVAPALPAEPQEPAIRHPLPEPEGDEALPALDNSDGSMAGALTALTGREFVERFVKPQDLVRHIVVTVDNLSTEKVAERVRPLNPIPGSFAVAGTEDSPVLDPRNFERYKPLVQLVRSMDTKLLVATYTRYYPLFQQAYESLGHPPEYFNDRVIEVIDHLLATPDLPGPVNLTQPGLMYEYADPQLEARSAGQKALLRMGSENATVIKDKLRELRGQLVARPVN